MYIKNSTNDKYTILVLFYSKYGATKQLARKIAEGIDSIDHCQSLLRTVPDISANCEQTAPVIPDSGTPFVCIDDLSSCDGLALGSPIRFGNMAAPMKFFLEQTTPAWISGALVGKPACVFASGSSQHGGQESTLLSMMLPLYHHGMILLGMPFTISELNHTTKGGTPYGVTHIASHNQPSKLDEAESHLAFLMGQRLAKITKALSKTEQI